MSAANTRPGAGDRRDDVAATVDHLESYVAECERKIEALEKRMRLVEARLEATIKVATREASGRVLRRLQEALSDDN